MPSDPNGILQAVYDQTNNQLLTETIAGSSTVSAVAYDTASILAKCYDSATGKLRVIIVA